MSRPGLAAFAVLLAAALVIYLPGTAGPYLADDFPNLAHNRQLLIQSLSWTSIREAALSSPSSPWYRPLSMLSFAFSYSLAGSMAPYSAKLVNILLHLCTGILVYLLALRLLPRMQVPGIGTAAPQHAGRIALFTAAFWLLHPLFVSTVLYAVQRMSILSALFILAGCLFYLDRRPRLAGMGDLVILAAGSALLTIVAFLCKENGALLPGFLLLMEIALFRFRFARPVPPALPLLLGALLVIPVLCILFYLAGTWLPRMDQQAGAYHFTVQERFLTQFRALFQYAGWLSLLSTEPMGLYHDDFPLSTGLLEPPATLAALLSWTALAVAGGWLTLKRHVAGFGVLWFLWGHLLESGVIPLAPLFEHRNYLPGFGLLLALTALLYGTLQQVRLSHALRMAVMLLVVVALPTLRLHERVRTWSDERSLVIHGITAQPASALNLLSAAVFLDSRDDPAAARTAIRQARLLDPREPAYLYAEVALHCEHQPRDALHPDLAHALLRRAPESPRTTTARSQYVQMVKACAQAPAPDPVLEQLYALRRHDRRGEVAMISGYGLGQIHLRRGEHARAARLWEEAVQRYPEGSILEPLLAELKRQMENYRRR